MDKSGSKQCKQLSHMCQNQQMNQQHITLQSLHRDTEGRTAHNQEIPYA